MKDYYKVLGIKPDVKAADIKKAYRKLAHKFHPDRNPDNPEYEQKFKEIVEANEILSDPQRRQQYDQALKGGGFSGIESMFANMFGTGFDPFNVNMRHSNPRRQNPTPDSAVINIELSLRDLEKGIADRSFRFTKYVACERCNGAGGKSIVTCQNCHGRNDITNQI